MGKYAAMWHLYQRGYIMLFCGIFNSNMSKACHSLLRRPYETMCFLKERMKRGICPLISLRNTVEQSKLLLCICSVLIKVQQSVGFCLNLSECFKHTVHTVL